ncbi:MAG: cation:proton antiporter [Bacteroidales bacterium]
MTDFFQMFATDFAIPFQNPVLSFLLILLVILFAPMILRKLNIPGIIGLIISGIAIGPHGFNLLENNSAIELFSTIGLLYIMFIAGLDLNLNEFKSNRYKSVLFGFLTFTIPLSIGFPICHYILNFSPLTALLTASLFATHTLVSYPIVSKLGVSKNKAVAVTVGGTIITDIAVLILLAIILRGNNGTLGKDFWIQLAISLAVFSLIMFWVLPHLAKWFFRKWENEKQTHYIFVLFILFLSGFLAQLAGLEPMIGAFIAGLVLNPLIPHSSILMNRIEFIGNTLFIPFFLISVGMIVDISVLLNGPAAIIIAVVLSGVAVFSKWFAALLTQLICKFSHSQRQLIFGLSSSHAAATLAVVIAGYEAMPKIMNESILNGAIILILVTCIISSFTTQLAAKKIAVLQKDEEEKNPQAALHHEQILIPISNMQKLPKILEFALLIKDKKTLNPISVLTVVPNDKNAEQNIIKSNHQLERYITEEALLSSTGVKPITTIDQNVFDGIARISLEIMADTLVFGWPDNTNLIDKSIHNRIRKLTSKIDKLMFFCKFETVLPQTDRMVLFTPPLSEHEPDFASWVEKIGYFSQELSASILHFGTDGTYTQLIKCLKSKKVLGKIQHVTFEEWEDFLILSRNIKEKDLLIAVTSRKGFFSYDSEFERIPDKLNKHFKKNTLLLIFPQQNSTHTVEVYEDVSPDTIGKSIKQIEKIGRGIKKVFNHK